MGDVLNKIAWSAVAQNIPPEGATTPDVALVLMRDLDAPLNSDNIVRVEDSDHFAKALEAYVASLLKYHELGWQRSTKSSVSSDRFGMSRFRTRIDDTFIYITAARTNVRPGSVPLRTDRIDPSNSLRVFIGDAKTRQSFEVNVAVVRKASGVAITSIGYVWNDPVTDAMLESAGVMFRPIPVDPDESFPGLAPVMAEMFVHQFTKSRNERDLGFLMPRAEQLLCAGQDDRVNLLRRYVHTSALNLHANENYPTVGVTNLDFQTKASGIEWQAGFSLANANRGPIALRRIALTRGPQTRFGNPQIRAGVNASFPGLESRLLERVR